MLVRLVEPRKVGVARRIIALPKMRQYLERDDDDTFKLWAQDLWLNGQRKYWLNNRRSENVFRHPRIYLGIMTLFGDPSLRLSTGAALAR
jgi:hypothetical protein